MKSFEELLDEDQSFSFHHQNFQVFVTEMYKVYSNVVIEIMNYILEQTRKYQITWGVIVILFQERLDEESFTERFFCTSYGIDF